MRVLGVREQRLQSDQLRGAIQQDARRFAEELEALKTAAMGQDVEAEQLAKGRVQPGNQFRRTEIAQRTEAPPSISVPQRLVQMI